VGACLKPEQTISIVYISRTTAPIKKPTSRMDLHCDCARKTISCTSFERVQPLRSDCKSEGQMEARMCKAGGSIRPSATHCKTGASTDQSWHAIRISLSITDAIKHRHFPYCAGALGPHYPKWPFALGSTQHEDAKLQTMLGLS